MNVGQRIRKIRKEKGISPKYVADQLGVAQSTLHRYENMSIEKIPFDTIAKISEILEVDISEILGNYSEKHESGKILPEQFHDPQEAMEFMLRMPTLAAFGGYDPESMSDETIVEFANEILQQLKIVSYKYKK